MRISRLATRLLIGGLFVGHGAQKLAGAFDGPGIEGTEKMTDAHLVYEGRDLRKQVTDAIASAAAQARLMRRVKEDAERQDALKKLE